jgi:voltage-gated potassium channel
MPWRSGKWRARLKGERMDYAEQLDREIQKEKERAKRKIIYALVMLGAVYVVAIAVFHYAEGWNWLDSIYFTTSTITTVGYGDMVPHTAVGRIFTIPLMWIGIAVGFYFIYTIQDYGKHKVERRIDWTLEHVERIKEKHLKRK